MSNQHTLFVCTSCAKPADPEAQGSKRGGEKLLEQFQVFHQDWLLRKEFVVQPVSCMGVCDRDCAIAFVAPGKFTYLFGSLPSDDATLSTTASAVFACASQYYHHAEGTIAYRERPELLRDTIIARIPPPPSL